MTTHPEEGTLQALLDGEVRPEERAALERHLAECPACAAEAEALREASAVFGSAVLLLDPPTEPAAVERARWRLEGVRRDRARAAGWGGATARRAALLLLGSAAVLSATVPGSPVREWLAGSNDAPVAAVHEEETAAPVAMRAAAAPSGVSVRPETGRMRVVLRDLAPGVGLRVQLHDGERVGVWASGEAARAPFRTAPERIELDGAAGGEIRVEVPRATAHFVLEVNGRTYLVKERDGLRFPGPEADTVEPEIVFEVRP
jgi:hypothetical protein